MKGKLFQFPIHRPKKSINDVVEERRKQREETIRKLREKFPRKKDK
jgi:hypothetical protein